MKAASYHEYIAEHVKACQRTGYISDERIAFSFDKPRSNLSLLHAIMGMQSELGEIADIIRRRVFYGVPLSVPTLLEEMGDFLYYWDIFAHQLREETCCASLNDITVRDLNRQKLALRYPDGYDNNISGNRELRDREAERAIFENAACVNE